MNKILSSALLSLLVVASAQAATVTITWDANHSPTGGEFILDTSDNGNFHSFCIEHNEYINPNGSSYTYEISGGAKAGGISGATGGVDPVSLGTAYLFRNFADHTLGGYNSNSSDDQNNLQNAIWWLEGELDNSYDYANNPYLLAAKAALSGNFDDLKIDGNGAYNVAAVNVYNSDGSNAQDQLIALPDGGTTLGMLGMACASLGLLRRKS